MKTSNLKKDVAQHMELGPKSGHCHNLIPNLACPAIITLPLPLPLHAFMFSHYHPSSLRSESQYKA
jgi:hypothetical protein